jgi:hypothetical protein
VFHPLNNWYQVTAVYNGTRLRLFVDGNLEIDQRVTGNLVHLNVPVTIGFSSSFNYYFNGTIDEVRIYNTALSQSDIALLFKRPSGGDVAVTSVSTSAATGNVGDFIPITIASSNNGTGTAQFTVFAKVNGTIVGDKPVTLAPGGSTTTILNWLTLDFTPGRYVVSANATLALDPTPSDNVQTDGTFTLLPSVNFGVSISPGSITIKPGTSGTSIISVANPSGFSGTATLSAVVSPVVVNGPSISLNPSTVQLLPGGTATSMFMASTAASTPNGLYTGNVTAAAGGVTRYTLVSIIVTSDFSVSVDPVPIILSKGSGSTVTVTVTSINTNGIINLASSVSPASTSAPSVTVLPSTINVTPSSSNTATLTISTSTSTSAGVYAVTVTGMSGSVSSSTGINLSVTALFTLHFRTCIDGSDFVYIQGTYLWIQHRYHELPGYASDCSTNQATIKTYSAGQLLLSSVSWSPNWFTNPTLQTPGFPGCGDKGCVDFTTSKFQISPAVTSVDPSTLRTIQGRGPITPEQNSTNGSPTIILLNDDGVPGAADYEFSISFQSPTQSFTLSISSGTGGNTIPGAGSYAFFSGQSQSVSAQPTSCYSFASWLLDGANAGAANPIVVVLNSDHSLQPTFGQIQYTLTIANGPHGTTSPMPGNYVKPCGASTTVSATPDSQYVLDHWTLDSSTLPPTNPLSVNSNANHMLTAFFVWGYALTVKSAIGGNTNPISGTYLVANQSFTTITAIPNAGYGFDHWTVNGTAAGTSTSLTVHMTANLVITPFFFLIVVVGGTNVPINKLAILAPYLAFALTISALGVGAAIYARRARHKTEKQ